MTSWSSGPNADARAHPRYAIRALVAYHYAGKRFIGITSNLALGGMKIETSHYLPNGEELEMQVVLGRKSITPKGRTIYSQPLRDGGYVSGLKFVHISGQDRGWGSEDQSAKVCVDCFPLTLVT